MSPLSMAVPASFIYERVRDLTSRLRILRFSFWRIRFFADFVLAKITSHIYAATHDCIVRVLACLGSDFTSVPSDTIHWISHIRSLPLFK